MKIKFAVLLSVVLLMLCSCRDEEITKETKKQTEIKAETELEVQTETEVPTETEVQAETEPESETVEDNVNIAVEFEAEDGCKLYDYVHLMGQEFTYDVYEVRSEEEYAHRKYEKYYWLVDVLKDGNKIATLRHDKPDYIVYSYPKAEDTVCELDVNFDGRNDVVFYHGYTEEVFDVNESKSFYTCYLQTDSGFEKFNGFETVYNACIDIEKKIYLSSSGNPYEWEIEASYKEENGKIVFLDSSQELAQSYEWLNDDFYGGDVYSLQYADSIKKDLDKDGVADPYVMPGSIKTEKEFNETLSWTLDKDGILTVSGEGKMTHVPWESEKAIIQHVVIEKGITTVAPSAFENCTNLRTVELPDSIYQIGGSAFENCKNLRNVTATENLRLLSCNSFKDSLWLKNQPDGIVYFGNIALGYKKDGKMVEGEYSNKVKIDNVILKEGTVGIAYGAFSYMLFDEYYIPDSVEYVGGSAFFHSSYPMDCGEDAIVYIGKTAYNNVGNMKDLHYDVVFKPGTKYITSDMFGEGVTLHHIDRIVLPESIEVIDDWAFSCDLLIAEIIYEGSEEQWEQVKIGKYNDVLKNANIRFAKN